MKWLGVIFLLSITSCKKMNGEQTSNTHPLSGGATTLFSENSETFTKPLANLTDEQKRFRFFYGKKLFNTDWRWTVKEHPELVTTGKDFIALSCAECHVRDGRSHTVAKGLGKVAPPVFGLGLLEAVPDQELLKLADPEDRDGDGISGRVSYVVDQLGKKAIGRFGWKAARISVGEQTAFALKNDLGVISSHFAGVVHWQQRGVQNVRSPTDIELLAEYTQLLGVPVRRNFNVKSVVRGEKLFFQSGCESCHVPKLVTGTHANHPELSNQVIFPFTDMLLHDMGTELALNDPRSKALASEWRTPPLWGIGLTKTINEKAGFLHDGRAKNLEEAILWHGGEGKWSKEDFMRLTRKKQSDLINFLQSL